MLRRLLLICLTIYCTSATAQIAITGTITDAETGELMIGVSILEKGTSNGTVSDIDGSYNITAASNGTLVFHYLGYDNLEIPINGRTRIDVQIGAYIQQLESVVVTAYGIEREKKATGFAFSEVDGDELTQAREVTVASQLVGKVPGLDITQPSNGPSGATRITVRGLSQFSGDNRPLLVIDGIPIDNSNTNTAGLYGGRDSGDAFSSINPDDIETITVLKGPASAALYGSRAANGVLLITTKKGSRRKGLGITFNSNYVTEEVTILPNFQNEYGQGANGQKPATQQEAFDNWRSWGARLDGSPITIFNGETLPYSAVGQDDIRDYYQRGSTWTNSLALTSTTDKMNSRLSVSGLSNSSIIPNTTYDRYTINLATQAELAPGLRLGGKATYALEEADNRTNLTDNPSNPSKYFTISPANLPHRVFQRTRDELGNPIYWSNNPFTLSPYWGPLENVNFDTKRRLTGFVKVSWEFVDGLSIQARAATDETGQDFLSAEIDGTQFIPPGSLNIDEVNIIERNYDLLLVGDRQINNDLRLGLNAGLVRTDRSFRRVGISGSDFINPGFVSINNMAIRNPGTLFTSRERNNGVFGTLTIGLKDFIYLEGSLRRDFFSTLTNPRDVEGSENGISYGSGAVSFVLSDAIDLPNWWSFAKLRAGYGSSGLAQIQPYSQVLAYSISSLPKETPDGNVTFGNISNTTFPTSNLRPSRTVALELGADLNFLNNRYGLEVTYYQQNTDRYVFNSPLPASTGFNSILINAGDVRNSGIELLARARVLDRAKLRWDLSVNFARNRNEVVALNDGVDQLNLGVDRTFSANIVAQIGGQIGDIWGNVYQRDANGAIVHGDDGLPLIADERQILGNFNPDWYGGLTSTLTLGNLSWSFLIDTKQGGEILSTTSSFGYLFGRHPNSLVGRDSPDFMMVGEGVDLNGEVNTNTARVDDYYGRVSSISEESVFDASYIKLRQMTLSYVFSGASLERLKFVDGITLSLVGRNLFFFSNGLDYIGLDPESIYTATGSDVGIEYAALPSTRTLGFNLQLRF